MTLDERADCGMIGNLVVTLQRLILVRLTMCCRGGLDQCLVIGNGPFPSVLSGVRWCLGLEDLAERRVAPVVVLNPQGWSGLHSMSRVASGAAAFLSHSYVVTDEGTLAACTCASNTVPLLVIATLAMKHRRQLPWRH